MIPMSLLAIFFSIVEVISLVGQVLLKLLYQNHFFPLTLIYFLDVIMWIAFLKLGLQFNGASIKLKKLLVYAFLLCIFSLTAEMFLPSAISSLIFIGTLILMLKLLSKVSFLKNILAVIFMLFLSSLGDIIMQSFIYFDNKLKSFFLSTTEGVMLGIIGEIAFPFFVMIIFSSFNISLTSYRKKLATVDRLIIILFSIFYSIIYFLVFTFFYILNSTKNKILIIMFFSELVLVIIAIVIFFVINYFSKIEHQKQLENQQMKSELEQSDRLLETFSSEQREYRNQLQVMKMLSQMGKNEELGKYIEQIATGMLTSFASKIESPIISSLLISELILAREQSVNINIQCHTSLKEINPVKISKILKFIIEIYIEQELAARNDHNNIFLEITENDTEYLFQFKHSEALFRKLATGNNNLQSILKNDNFTLIAAMLNDMGGDYQLLDQDYTLLLRFALEKDNQLENKVK